MRTVTSSIVAFVFVFLFGSTLAGHAWGATVSVNAGNTSGIEDGTSAYPYDTIQEGIAAAQPGDTVSVAPGIYYGAIGLRGSVKLVSEQGPEVTIIDGLGQNPAVTTAYETGAQSYIEGFTVRNGGWLISANTQLYGYAQIHNCILTDAEWGAIGNGYHVIITVTRTVIKNVPIALSLFLNMFPTNFKNVTIDNVETGIQLYKSYAALTNVTITNAQNALKLWGYTGNGSVYGTNNNVWNCQVLSAPNWNDLYLDITGLQAPLAVDPLFADRVNGNYHLSAGSPLIDAGIDVGYPYVGDAPDIGAYEYAVVSLPDMVSRLAESFAETSPDAFKNAAEQRSNALQNKLMAALRELDKIADEMTAVDKVALYSSVMSKLKNDILAKTDGFYGGNPKNDWITTKEEQDRLYPEIIAIIEAIQKKMEELMP